ncbi:MAG TPA: acetylornithine/succinylornithine family transaminase [Thermoanaerobaculia bacterium]|nr:acetylornithine/succinylornithine family transaminase [Thermoanaerobaculia bacterium]
MSRPDAVQPEPPDAAAAASDSAEAPAEVEARDRGFVLGTYARTPFHPRSGRGARLVDAAGKEYWDLLAGIAVNALGSRHPRLVRALAEGSRGVWHLSNLYYHPAQGLLAERLVRASGLSKAFFCNSGTEAIEAALKLARLANPGRAGVVAVEESFHGRTFGALSVTGHEDYRRPFVPLVPGARFVPPNDPEALRRAVSEETSAILLEPVMGEAGIVPLTDAFLRSAREAADRTGAVLIFDEIQCGLGRTGTLFAFERAGVLPDAVTLAKALGGGLPLGAVVVGERLAGAVRPGHHGTTFGGNPLACRLGLAFLDEIEERELLARIRGLGRFLGAALSRLARRNRSVREVRGAGLMWGIELDRPSGPVARRLLDRGFVVGTARERVLRLLPPYVVPRTALAAFVRALDETLLEEVPA